MINFPNRKADYSLKNNVKLLVRVNGVSFYTTVKNVRDGIGDNPNLNACCRKALWELDLPIGDPVVMVTASIAKTFKSSIDFYIQMSIV